MNLFKLAVWKAVTKMRLVLSHTDECEAYKANEMLPIES